MRATAFHSPCLSCRLPPGFFDGCVNDSGSFSGSIRNSAVPCGGVESPANFSGSGNRSKSGLSFLGSRPGPNSPTTTSTVCSAMPMPSASTVSLNASSGGVRSGDCTSVI